MSICKHIFPNIRVIFNMYKDLVVNTDAWENVLDDTYLNAYNPNNSVSKQSGFSKVIPYFTYFDKDCQQVATSRNMALIFALFAWFPEYLFFVW